MESLKGLDVSSLRGPCFATIEQHRNTDNLVDRHLGGDAKIVIEEHSMQQSAEGRGSSLNMMLNFTVQTEVITQYTPQVCKLPCLNKMIAMHRKRRCMSSAFKHVLHIVYRMSTTAAHRCEVRRLLKTHLFLPFHCRSR